MALPPSQRAGHYLFPFILSESFRVLYDEVLSGKEPGFSRILTLQRLSLNWRAREKYKALRVQAQDNSDSRGTSTLKCQGLTSDVCHWHKVSNHACCCAPGVYTHISLPCNWWRLTRNRKYGIERKEWGKLKDWCLVLGPSGTFPRNKGGEMKNLKQGLYFVTSCTDMACCQSFPVTRDQWNCN